jgi:syntaxin 8
MSRGGDKWLEAYARACDIAEDTEAAIYDRNQLEQQGQSSAKVTSTVRRFLNELALQVQTLEDLVNQAHKQYHLTDAEFDERNQKVNELKLKRDDLQNSFSQDPMAGGSGGYTNEAFSGGGGGGGGGYEHDAYSRQQQVMADQDQGLDILQQSIARQKNIGMAIGNELDDQDVMLSDLSDAMDNTDAKLIRQTNQVIKVTEKAKGMGMCCCIALLVIAVITVWAV